MSVLDEQLNDDFSQRVMVSVDELAWVPSPVAGVLRKPLDRIGGEVARATTVVQFQPESYFDAHTHGGGEEILVLRGSFSDESGDYGALSYVRNPPGSAHKPFSREGCDIFVKLCQMKPTGEPQISVDSTTQTWQPVAGEAGVYEKRLFQALGWFEEVSLMKVEEGAAPFLLNFAEGGEVLLLEGELLVDGAALSAMGWLRFPKGASAQIEAPAGAVFWLKRGIDFPS